MKKATKTVSLVLISSALILSGCSRSREEEERGIHAVPQPEIHGDDGGGSFAEEDLPPAEADIPGDPDREESRPGETGSSSHSPSHVHGHGHGYWRHGVFIPVPIPFGGHRSSSRPATGPSSPSHGSSSSGSVSRGGFGSSGSHAGS